MACAEALNAQEAAYLKALRAILRQDPDVVMIGDTPYDIDAEGLAYRGSFVVNPEGKIKLVMDGEDYKAYVGRAKAAQEKELAPEKPTPQ